MTTCDLIEKWLARERELRRRLELARRTGDGFAAIQAQADELRRCRVELQKLTPPPKESATAEQQNQNNDNEKSFRRHA